MAMTCKKCGTPATEDQAFCAKCGAVLGMNTAPPPSTDEPNFAATIVGGGFKPPPRPPAPTPKERAPVAPAPAPPPPTPRPEPPRPVTGTSTAGAGGSSNTILFVIIGFIAVLLLGGLALVLLYFFMGS